jgi:hypothetical protein
LKASDVRICIAHASWLPERRETLARLLETVPDAEVFRSKRREPACIWARRVWEWAEDGGGIILNDDVQVHPEIGAVVEAMLQSVQGEALSLHPTMPVARDLADAGSRWMRCHWYTGPGVYLPARVATELLEWGDRIGWETCARLNEDNLAIYWAIAYGKPFWMPLPAPVAHNAEARSTMGYEHHPFRSCTVPWTDYPEAKMTDPDFWRSSAPNTEIPNPWMPAPAFKGIATALLSGKGLCSMCLVAEPIIGSANGARLCASCIADCINGMGKKIKELSAR